MPRDWTVSDAQLRQDNQGSLSARQVDEYDSLGYLVIPGFLDEDDLAPAKRAMTHKVDLIAGDLLEAGLIADTLEGEPFETRLARVFDDLGAEHFLAYGRGWRDRFPGYYQLMSNGKILDAVESLIGPELFANPVYNVRPKVPKVAAGAVPWHQDKSYWPGSTSNPVVTVWVACVDATMENGCLHVIPHTQDQNVGSFHAESYSGTGYTELDSDVLASAQRRATPVPVPVAAGSAIIFNDRFIHSSTPNRSDGVRWSVDLRYQPADQDPMPQHGAGFLARSRSRPRAVGTLDDWLEGRLEADVSGARP